MHKIKKSVFGFLGAVCAEIQRFQDFIDQEDEKWRLDPVATEKRWNAVWIRFDIWTGAIILIGIVLGCFV